MILVGALFAHRIGLRLSGSVFFTTVHDPPGRRLEVLRRRVDAPRRDAARRDSSRAAASSNIRDSSKSTKDRTLRRRSKLMIAEGTGPSRTRAGDARRDGQQHVRPPEQRLIARPTSSRPRRRQSPRLWCCRTTSSSGPATEFNYQALARDATGRGRAEQADLRDIYILRTDVTPHSAELKGLILAQIVMRPQPGLRALVARVSPKAYAAIHLRDPRGYV